MQFVTVEDVDGALGIDWAPPEKKGAAVIEANIWLAARVKPAMNPIPDAVKAAGCLVAKRSADGLLYVDSAAAIKRKRIRAEGAIDTETEWQDGSVSVSAFAQRMADLLAPYLRKAQAVQILKRL